MLSQISEYHFQKPNCPCYHRALTSTNLRGNIILVEIVTNFLIRYGIAGLKRLAKKKFAVQIEQHRTSREFADCLAVVYHTTPQTDRGLKDIVVSTFRKYPELLRNEGVGNSARVTSELAWDLCMMAMGLPV